MPEYRSGFYIGNRGCVPLIRHGMIPFPHGFSTRLGGVSREPGYETLDLGAGSWAEAINENRRRFARAISGADGVPLVFARQIHSARAVYIDSPGGEYECDALVTDIPGIIIAVKTADCVPILFCDPVNRVVGAAHAGWRGTAAGVAAACLRKMTERGADPGKTIAAIGPCIGSCCYEVDDRFVSAVSASECAEQCLGHISGGDGRYHADLRMMDRDILISCGVPAENIYLSGFCTSCGNELFFSHRAGKGVRGLMMSGIMLPDE